MKPLYNEVKFKQGPHIAGLCEITIMPIRWLSSKWDPDFKTAIVADIDVLPPFAPTTIRLIDEFYELQENAKRNKAGTYYDISLTGISNDIDYDTMMVLNTYRYEEWLVIFKDKKHRMKIAGNLDGGFTFDFTNEEKNAKGGEQRISLSLTMSSEYPSFFFGKKVEEIIVLPKLKMPGGTDFDVSLNEDEDGLLVYFGTAVIYPSGVSFVLERSTVADFSSDVVTITLSGGDIAAGVYNDTTVTPNVTYYYRMKATKAGYTDSDWSIDSDMVPAAAALPLDDLWLDMDSEAGLTTSVVGPDTFVDSWEDQASGIVFTPFDAHKLVVVNDVTLGKNVLTNENDSNAWLVNLNVANMLPDNAAGMTIYIVGRQKITNDTFGRFFTSGANIWVRRNSAETKLNVRMRPGAAQLSNNDVADDTWYTIRGRYDGTNQYLSKNNTTELVQALSDSFWSNGATGIFGNPSNKAIARILVYRRNHSADEMNQVEAFLQNLYGHY